MNLNQLEQLAKAATPGPWIGAGPSFGGQYPRFIDEVVIDRPDEEEDGETVCVAIATKRENSTFDLNFIAAANPETILSLIGLLREMAGALDKAIEFVPTGYGLERQCWEALAKYKEIAG